MKKISFMIPMAMFATYNLFLLLLLLLLFLILIFPAASPLSFNMTPITNSDGGSFNLSQDVYLDGGIQVTTNDRYKAQQSRSGRAIYKEPLHLWDRASANLTDFSTHFSFVIDSNGNADYADGLTFFMAPLDAALTDWSKEGSLGIGNTTNSSAYPFVALEFDTYLNPFDPPYAHVNRPYPHVGIDINNMTSVNATPWYNNVTMGFQNDASVTYDATSKLLTLQFTAQNASNLTTRGSLTYTVDLRDFLPEYVAVGFSAATGRAFEKHNVKSWSFSSTLQLHQNLPTTTSSSNKKGRRRRRRLLLGLGGGLLTVLLLASASAMFVMRKKKKQQQQQHGVVLEEKHMSFSELSMDNEFQKGSGPRKFTYNELVLATDNFAEEHKLGEGGFGGVYRGLITTTNTYIAVKRVSKGSKQGRKEYAAEVKIISQLRHINLVQLIGWCHQKAELLLVYEFMPNGSLDSHLFRQTSELTWEMRYRIAQGLASALLYLHEELRQYVVHRDIKASNIMLDASFNAKLGDFGLARLVDHDKDSETTIPAGTFGYIAPEYPVTGRASKETDVYSFGIVLLEIACGRRPIDHRNSLERVVLVEWVWSMYGAGQLLDAADPKLELTENGAGKTERLMVVGLWCVHPDCRQRPSIRQVMQVLNSEAPLPRIPPAMPKPIYETPTPGSMVVTNATSNDSLIFAQYTNSNSNSNSNSSTSATAP